MPIKNIVHGQTVTKEKLQRAKELRRDMTPAEKILWQELRANKLGVHFSPLRPLRGAPPPITTIQTLNHHMKYTSSYLGEDGWGRLFLSQGGVGH